MPKKMSKVEQIAFNIACEAPVKASNTYAARVPWSDIKALRAEFERLGWDWKAYATMYQDGIKNTRAENLKKRQASDAELMKKTAP